MFDKIFLKIGRNKSLLLMGIILLVFFSYFVYFVPDLPYFLSALFWLILMCSGILVLDIATGLSIGEIDVLSKALKKFATVVNSATESIEAIIGNTIKNKEIREALKRKIKQGINVEMICGNKIDQKNLKEFSSLLSQYPNFSLLQIRETPVPRNIIIVDSCRLALEECGSENKYLFCKEDKGFLSFLETTRKSIDFFREEFFKDYRKDAIDLRKSTLKIKKI